jgi:hypothetical protein
MNNKFLRSYKNKILKPFIAFYFFVGCVEIIAELFTDYLFISLTKMLLMPILISIYWLSSKSRNNIFILGLITVWISNIFFISNSVNFFILGTLFFLIYCTLIFFLVLKNAKFPGLIPMIIGSLPFLFIFFFVINISQEELGSRFYLFLIQGIFIIFLGSLSLGNYILKPNTSNTYLLLSTFFFTVSHIIMMLNIFYPDYDIFQPLAIMLYVFGQYLLYLFMILEEKKRKRFYIINNSI